MKAIYFKEHTTVLAKSQKEYQEMPVHYANGLATACFELDQEELDRVYESKTIRVRVLNFNGPVQPMEIKTSKPVFPILPTLALNCNPEAFDFQHGTAVMLFEFSDEELIDLAENKCIWVIISNLGAALLPISADLVWE